MTQALVNLPWWGYVLTTLGLTHITIVGVTLYLHRHQTHMALTLHPIVSHFFRFWLWITTGMVTKEWVAIHRKHHAKVESAEDPHSPQAKGLNKVLWLGVFLYHKETQNPKTMEQYGYGTPDDWIERNLYTPHTYLGPIAMLALDLLLFGLMVGPIIWVVQMIWIPFWAAGVINGVGHFSGYRNFELTDASRNITPWGILIGGEELHNNHHAYASSAKFSSRRWEFDLGWVYIKVLQALRLSKVKKLAPQLIVQHGKGYCDIETVKAVLGNRFQVMANYIKEVLKDVCTEEIRKVDRSDTELWRMFKRAKHLMAREATLLDAKSKIKLERMLHLNPKLHTVYFMKKRLQDIWSGSSMSPEHLMHALEEWCHAAESSGIEALNRFSNRLRCYCLASPLPVAAS